MTEPGRQTIRLDKWLWHARFFKTRSLAAKTVSAGHVRVNATRISKPAHSVGPGDTLTFPQANRIRVIKILNTGTRRGPAPEAQALYDDHSAPVEPQSKTAAAPKFDGGGRPTKRDRRRTEAMRGRDLE